ncbi:MAG: helix-turn-helix domain-containing protein [Verrucomicrobiia bacterium]|jgi:excisionase family DNA binding protein
MNGMAPNGGREGEAPLPRLYLRPNEAARAIGVSRRTLSEWQSSRLIGFRRVGRTVLFSVADILAAIERYRIAPLGEPKRPQQHGEIGTVPGLTTVNSSESPRRKRRIERITPEPATS